ncbi:hypothetical protein [Undibacterium sp. TS12]|uniref:hypothetical protein n=1 Tax=Undibacterium sp. TS12 TaxID=2908202 RepID=UPI001F4CD489|nr:hypothetical protein [Undibacterium sp. TS12]MCH8622799.1 hypothetical protein [Undibacterium sp. TS12]
MSAIVLHYGPGETYSLEEMPAIESEIVKDSISKILGHLNLDELSTNLELVGALLKLAYNGVAGFEELEKPMLVLHEQFGHACMESHVGMTKFSNVATSVQSCLLRLVGHLYANKINLALVQVNNIKKFANMLHKTAVELTKEFQALAHKSRDLAGDVGVTDAQQRKLLKKIESDMNELNSVMAGAESLSKSYEEMLKDKQKARAEIVAKLDRVENQAIRMSMISAIMGPISEGVGAFCAVYSGGALTSSIKAIGSVGKVDDQGGGTPKPGESATELQTAINTAKAEQAKLEAQKKKLSTDISKLEEQLEDFKSRQPGDGKEKDKKIAEKESGKAGRKEEDEDEGDEDGEESGSASKSIKKTKSAHDNDDSDDDGDGDSDDRDDRDDDSDDGDGKEITDQLETKRQELEDVKKKLDQIEADIKKTAAAHAIAAAAEAAKRSAENVKKDLFSLVEQYNQRVSDYDKKIDELQENKAQQIAILKRSAASMQNYNIAVDDIGFARSALLVAQFALKNITVCLREMEKFWRVMEAQCEKLSASETLSIVNDEYVTYTNENVRAAMEDDHGFQKGVVNLYCNWVAVQKICFDLGEKSARTEKQVHRDFKTVLSIEKRRALAIADSKKIGGKLDNLLENNKDYASKLKNENESDAISEKEIGLVN